MEVVVQYCILIWFKFQTSDSVLILRDGNSTIYPLAKDCVDSIRDPHWLDLPPVRCIGAGTHALSVAAGSNLKNQVAVIVLALESQVLMPRILRCDFEGVKQVLMNLEQEASKSITSIKIQFGGGGGGIGVHDGCEFSKQSSHDNFIVYFHYFMLG
jgi:E3 ubiquitin-protein ligase EDD1